MRSVSRLFRPKRQGDARRARGQDGQRPESLMLTDSLLEQNGMRSAGPARAATIALGIASAFENIERRNAARETWMRLQSVGRTLHVRFVLRVPTVGGTSALRTARLERNIHKDVLIVRVSPGVIDALHGRLLTLHLWLQRAVVLFRRCAWICKADDDAYIVVPSYAQQLGLMSRALSPHNRSIIHGWLGWSAWDPFSFMPEIASSFDGDFCKTGRAGLLFGDRCRGSFPFVSGWLISLSSHLARALAASAAAAHDVHTMTGHLNRSWIVLEDVWLGYLLHEARRIGPDAVGEGAADVVWVGAEHGNVFNGVSSSRVFASPDLAYPTTYVYHHPALALSHAHAMRAHKPPRPALQCTRQQSAGEGLQMAPWVRSLANGFEAYARAQPEPPEHTPIVYCMMVDLT